VFRAGYVVVGRLPTRNGNAKTATAGALYVLNSTGHLVETITGADINGPWDMTSYDGGGFGAAALVIGPTGVALGLNGTVYVADTLSNKITAIRDGRFRHTSAGTGVTRLLGGRRHQHPRRLQVTHTTARSPQKAIAPS